MKRILSTIAAATLLSGCWTFGTSEYPQTQAVAAPASTNVTVAVTGFAATLTWVTDAVSYDTVYVPGYYGRRHYRPGYVTMVPVRHYISESAPTDAFRLRAQDLLEKAGYSVGAATPDWTVDVTFSGPARTSGDMTKELAWMVCTVFFCDYDAETWTAQLRIRDNRTGKLVFHNDYSQRYETKVFGLIPLFGPASCEETGAGYMQSWCLSALTDRAVADATSFLSKLH